MGRDGTWPFDYRAFVKKCRDFRFKDYQCWWYASLLASAFLNEERPGYLRNMPCDLYQQAGVTVQLPLRGELLKEWAAVLARFVVTDDGWITHPRLIKELEVKEKRAKAGATSKSEANREQTENAGMYLVSLDSISLEIYKTYPRKVKKDKALKAIKKAIKDVTKASAILWVDREGNQQSTDIAGNWENAARFILWASQEFASSPAGQSGQYTPYPATWFNASQYFDDRREWYRGAAQTKNKQQSGLDAFSGAFAEVSDGEAGGGVSEPAGSNSGDGPTLPRGVRKADPGSGLGAIRGGGHGEHSGMHILPRHRGDS